MQFEFGGLLAVPRRAGVGESDDARPLAVVLQAEVRGIRRGALLPAPGVGAPIHVEGVEDVIGNNSAVRLTPAFDVALGCVAYERVGQYVDAPHQTTMARCSRIGPQR